MKWVKFRGDFTPNGALSRLSVDHETPRYYSLGEKIEIIENCFIIDDKSVERKSFEEGLLNKMGDPTVVGMIIVSINGLLTNVYLKRISKIFR